MLGRPIKGRDGRRGTIKGYECDFCAWGGAHFSLLIRFFRATGDSVYEDSLSVSSDLPTLRLKIGLQNLDLVIALGQITYCKEYETADN